MTTSPARKRRCHPSSCRRCSRRRRRNRKEADSLRTTGAAAARYARKPAKKKSPWITVLRVLLWVIGIPAVIALVALGWLMTKDKSSGTLVSSGVNRTYLLYVPKSYERCR